MTTPAQPRTATARRTARIMALALALLGLCATQEASAEFVPAPLPGGLTSIRTLAVLDQSSWAAHVSPATGQRVSVTSDRGATWVDAAGLLSADDSVVGLAAAPGQTYRAAVRLGVLPIRIQVKSITRAGTVTNLGSVVSRHAFGQGSTAVDDAGTTWVPNVPSPTDPWGVILVTASGATTVLGGAAGAATPRVDAVRTPDGMRVWAHGLGSYRVEGGALVLDGPEPVLLRDGQLVFTPGSTSYDGGAHFLARPGRQVVSGAPGQPATTHLRVGQRIATRYDERLFRGAPPRVPNSASVVSTGSGFVAWSTSTIAVHDGDLPPSWPASIGALQADSSAMLEVANGLRADVGLPPLIGDAALAQAARNHAGYDTQWHKGHSETAGRAGFTGRWPAERCAFVGATCSTEVMHFNASPRNSVGGWIVTPYHRPPLMSPRAGLVGPASSGYTAVMVDGENLQELVAAVGYPQGNYRGWLAFSGESPDPTVACAAKGQPVTWPVGAAVTLFAPTTALMTGVREVGGGALAGCVLGDVFLPEDPLVAGRSYEATGTWDLGGGARRTHTWTFTASPDAPPAGGLSLPPFFFGPSKTTSPRDSAKPRLTMTSMSPLRFRAAAHGASIVTRGSSRVAFTLSERATVRFEVERAQAGRRAGGRCVASSRSNRRAARCTRYVRLRGSFGFNAKSGRNAIRFSGRLRGRKLTAGQHRLRAVATDAARNTSSLRRSRVFTIVRR